MTALTVNKVVDAGTAGATQTPTASDTADYGNGRNTFLVYRNTGATPLVLTIVVPGTNVYGSANPDPTITVPITTGEKWIPLRRELDDGNLSNTVTITATGTAAGQTVQLVRVDFA